MMPPTTPGPRNAAHGRPRRLSGGRIVQLPGGCFSLFLLQRGRTRSRRVDHSLGSRHLDLLLRRCAGGRRRGNGFHHRSRRVTSFRLLLFRDLLILLMDGNRRRGNRFGFVLLLPGGPRGRCGKGRFWGWRPSLRCLEFPFVLSHLDRLRPLPGNHKHNRDRRQRKSPGTHRNRPPPQPATASVP